MKVVRIVLVTCLLFLAGCSMTLSSQVVSPLSAGSTNTSYSYTFAATAITVPAGSQLLAQFDVGSFAISQANNCQLSINGATVSTATCSVNPSSNAVVFSNVAASSISLSTLSMSFYSNGAGYSGTSNILFYFQDSTGLQNTDSKVNTTVSIVAATMNGCSVTTTNQTVGASSTYSFTYSPTVAIPTGSILQLVLPAWFGNGTNLLNNASANCSSNCSALLISSSESIIFRLLYASSSAAIGTSQSASVNSIKNPPSTAPISIQILVQTSASQNVQQCFVQLAVTNPNNLITTFNIPNTAISASNSIRLSFRSSNPIPGATSYLRISTSLALSYTYSAANSLSTVAPVRVSSTDGSVLISGLSTSNIASLSLYYLGMFTLVNAPSSKRFTITFTTQTFTSSTFYSIDSSTINVQAAPATITTASVSAQNNIAYAIGQFSVSFTTVNALISGSFAVLQFPSEMTVTDLSTCTTNVGRCFFSGGTVTVNVQNAFNAGTNITTILSLVQNPLTTTTSSTFTISTYYDTSDSLVDQLLSGLTFTAQPTPVKAMQVIPLSKTVRDVTSYTFNINFTNPIPSSVTLYLTFPATLPISSVFYTSNNTLPCIVSTNLQTVTLASCFSSTFSSTVTFTLGSITNPTSTKPTSTFNITSYYNGLILEYLSTSVTVAMTTPMAFGPLTLSASNFTVNALATYTFSVQSVFSHSTGDKFLLTIPSEVSLTTPQCTAVLGISSLSCALSGTTLTVNLTGSSIGALINFTVSGFLNNWYTSTSSFTIQSATNDANQYLIESGSTTLSFVSGTMGSSAASDNQIVLLSQSTIKLTITAPFTLTKATNNSGLTIEITAPTTSFTAASTGCNTNGTCTYNSTFNGYQVTSLTSNSFPLLVTFSAQTGNFTNSDAFTIKLSYQNQLISTNINTTVAAYCTTPCQQCTLTRTTCASCLSSTYTNNVTLFRGNSSCVQTCPDSYYASSTTSACEICNVNCTKCFASPTNCSACTPGSGTYFYNNACTDTCLSNYYKNNTTVACTQCPVGCNTCTNSTFCVTCQTLYFYNAGSCVSSCPNNSYVPVNGVCTLCATPCYTCSGTTNNCTGCANTLILYNSTCITQCPSLTYFNGSSCHSCQSPCVECTSNLICTSCNSSMSLFNNRTCVTPCPSGYISLAQVCTACSAQCLTCSVLINNCTSCSGSLYLYNGNTCVATCPSPFQPNGNICSACLSPCLTCAGTASNCTSCQSSMYLLNASCYVCQSPCVTCSSNLICTSCNSSMSLYDNRTCVTSCPSGYISLAQVCTACSAECATCSVLITNCTSCSGSLYLYNSNACLATCPSPLQPNGNICSNCVSPCLTCTGLASNCTSCQNTLYLQNNSCYACQSPCVTCTSSLVCTSCNSSQSLFDNRTCLTTCPSGYISLAQICTACSSQCGACSVLITNCTSCSGSRYLYNGNTCVTSCPSPTLPNGNVCSGCVATCLTCSGTASNCTSCQTGMYLLNNSCYTCQPPCVTCNTSLVCTSCSSSMSLFDNRTCLSTCPSGYLSLAQLCTACSSQCATCSGITTNCTSCPGNLYLYNNNTCVASCPSPTHPYGKNCTLCISPCATCTGTAANCTSCESNILLLNNSCYSQCPSGYYTNNQQCYSCGNCLACITATNCTTCNAGNYLLDGLCYSSCPATSPVLVGQSCVSCSSECFTCQALPINCTSCSTTTFLLRYTCVASCPLGMYTDRTTNKCLDSLSNRIVFFPILIICVILAALVLVSKCFARNTALVTAFVACFAIPQLCIYVYYTIQLSLDQEGINTLVMMILAITGIGLMLVVSITFYVLNRRRIKEDPYLAEWLESPCNYHTYLICMHVALLNLKFYRIVYCRMFNSQALSLFLKFPKSVFPLTTVFTIILLFLSEILVVVSAVLTLYNKNNKDQVFYTALECLLVTALSSIMSLVDIYKDQDFFSQSQYLMTKKYVDRTKDDRKAEVDEVSIFDVPSMAVDSENCFGTGQKSYYNKDSAALMFVDSTNNKIEDQIDDDELSHNQVQTQIGHRRPESQYGSSRKKRINIFQPIREEEAEEDIDAQTIEKFYRTHDDHAETNFEQVVRANLRREKSDVGQSPPKLFDIVKDDIRSVAEPKELRKRWDQIIEARKQEARRLFRTNKNTAEMGTTNKFEGYTREVEIPKGRRKRLKVTKSMKRTQEIYLQRLVVLEDKDRPAPTSLKKKRKRKNRKESEQYCFPDI